MYLSRLHIQNYRSIKSLDLKFSPGKNVIVGKNNCGKSNIVRALDLLLGESNPTWKNEHVGLNDFRCWKEREGEEIVIKSADHILIWCELDRGDDEALNYEELYKCYGFHMHSRVLEWEDRRPLRKESVRIDRASMPADARNVFNVDDDTRDKDYVNPKVRNQRTFESALEDKYRFALVFLAEREEDGTVSKKVRMLFRENGESDWILCFAAPIRGALIQSAIMHSFRDPQNQLRLSSWTWYGKLLKHLTRAHEESPEIKQAFEAVREVSDEVFADVKSKIEESALQVAFPGTEIHFQFNADSRADLYKNCVIYVDDGFKSLLTEKGAGIQSATIIGLFNYYTRHVNTISSALLCLEEPEIYLHPHARRVVSDRLDEFLEGERNQVILTTHSSEFIRATGERLNVILVRKDSDGTTARTVNVGEFKSLLVNNNQNELFFADSVIVCEGFDEYVIRAIADDLHPHKLDERNVSIVAVGGKDNFASLVSLVLRLRINCFIVADFDFLLRDREPEREQYGQQRAHDSLADLGQAFFAQKCIYGNRGAAAHRGLQDLRAEIKAANPQGFYNAKKAEEIQHERLENALTRLREHGVCILSGQIEDLSQDAELLSPDLKLSLSRVSVLAKRLSDGERASDLFHTGELADFLSTVFAGGYVAPPQPPAAAAERAAPEDAAN